PWEARLWQAAARVDEAQFTSAEAICRAMIAVDTPPDARVRASTVLARVLLWQGRVDEALGLELRIDDEVDDSSIYTAAMRVRVLVSSGRLFDAGQRARELLTRAEASG